MKRKVASVVFGIGALWGAVSLIPMLFMYEAIGKNEGETITHPGFYFGFLSLGLAWSALCAVIAWEPARMRPLMIPAAVGKAGYALAIYLLFRQGRTSAPDLVFGAMDLLLALTFAVVYAVTLQRELRSSHTRNACPTQIT